MNRIKRWTSALTVRVDRIMAQVENHEALAEAAIRDVRRAAAQAKVQLARVERDGEAIGRQLEERRTATVRWRERARSAAETDADRAVECLRRSKRAAAAIPDLEGRLGRHQQAHVQLRADVAKVEERLESLREKRNLMRLRQSRAEALSGAHAAELDTAGEVSEIFDRWDARITELELDDRLSTRSVDALDFEYSEVEEREELLAELATLTESAESAGSADVEPPRGAEGGAS